MLYTTKWALINIEEIYMTDRRDFKLNTKKEFFLEIFQRTYSQINPENIENYGYNIQFSDDLLIQDEEDFTSVIINARDTLGDILLPVISFSIYDEGNTELKIVAQTYPYYESDITDLFREFLSRIESIYSEVEFYYLEINDFLLEQPSQEWKGESIGTIKKRLRVQKDTLLRMIKIEEEHIPNGLTQKEMGKEEKLSCGTIKKNIAKMKLNNELFPNTAEHYTRKITP